MADLVRRYFKQLTEGCGRPDCPNRHCLSCADGPGQLDRTSAALRSLELAQGTMHHLFLCDEQPPFLHLSLMRNLIAEGTSTGDWRALEKEVSGVFSNVDALNRSFLLNDAARQAAAKNFQVSAAHEPPPAVELMSTASAACCVLRAARAAACRGLLRVPLRDVDVALR
jgi:hypothetical protein